MNYIERKTILTRGSSLYIDPVAGGSMVLQRESKQKGTGNIVK